MIDIKATFAANLITLRKQFGMSQSELGEKLNYSDKTISKWERGEGLPDVTTLMTISEIFQVSTDWLLKPHKGEWIPKPDRLNAENVIRVALIGVWTVAILIFVVLWLVDQIYWTIFAFALPAFFVTWLVLNSVFYKGKNNMWIVHGLLLSAFIVVYFALYQYNIWQLCFVAIPAHAIVSLSFHLKKKRSKK